MLRDYAEVGLRLFWQRHAMYFGAFILAAVYYSTTAGILCYWAILLSEFFDRYLGWQIYKSGDLDPRKIDIYYRLITVGTILNSSAIGAFVVVATIMEGTAAHFTPLLFLFAAALFAAMNSHQIIRVLVIRLSIYAALFTFVALTNLLEIRPPLTSVHWLQFFTVIFVMYFIVDCSLVFLKMYRRNLAQIDDLRMEHERALAAYRAKTEFLSVVSHELRTPITSIKGPLNLICAGVLGPIPDDIQQMLSTANKNSDRLASLIDDLLDLQALETEKMSMFLRPIDLSKLLRDAIEANGGYLRSKNVSIRETGLDSSVIVEGDEKRLMQVMANVLSNAIKFSNDEGVVEVGLERLGNEARISVKDYGRGIPDHCEERVFGEFTQIDSSDVRSVGGTGLGMSISKRIMTRHEGAISYESEPGVGTTFYITLPIGNETTHVPRPYDQSLQP